MILQMIDWLFIISFFLISLGIGLALARKAGSDSTEFFASGRSMPWWLLGISMVATTFSADTPNLVADLVRQKGVSGNWLWWAFLLTGMVTVFIYARLWRRSAVLTDVEFYEIRYSGKAAAFLRGFRALYLGIFFNVMIMATVLLAAIKIGGVMLDLSPFQSVFWAALVTVAYSMLGGLRGVLITDFVQFLIAMFGSVYAAWYVVQLPEVGGLTALLANPAVQSKLSLLPDFNDHNALLTVLIIPLAVQWWSVWYPGSEPGGGGYVAQRMLAAKDERNAMGATLLFNLAHYALRPWPWIFVALASLVLYPDLQSLATAFPHVDAGIVKNDLAYSAMLTHLPSGVLGIVIASLIAAVMSTISTHLNWGASYVVNDFYKRFVNRQPDERQLVSAGRITILILMVLAAVMALLLSNALQAFHILLQIGAGTGLLFLLRWFWWRINAASEIAAMVISFAVAVWFELIYPALGLPPIAEWVRLVSGVAITTIGWVGVALVTKPTDSQTLISFYKLVRPGGRGWRRILAEADESEKYMTDGNDMGLAVLGVFSGLVTVYNAIFATGFWFYGRTAAALLCSLLTLAGSIALFRIWGRLKAD